MAKQQNKTIAKNTLFLYLRMFFVMAVSVYTSRVILNTLGVQDYGLYQVVGGVVSMLSVLSTALDRGSSRFLLFELGKGESGNVTTLFSTLLNAHIILAVILVLLAESLGLWCLYTKVSIPTDRFDAAIFTYQLSILTMFFGVTQTPFSAVLKSFEKFNIYAYVSIFEVTSKLVIAYAIVYSPVDKLVFYASLNCVVSMAVIIFYRIYCFRKFDVIKYKLVLEQKVFANVAKYCGWNIIQSISNVLNNQGLIIILNNFFSATIITSMSVATTVKNAANSFVQNFRTASIPQTVKLYSSGEINASEELLYSTMKYSYFLMLILGLPIFLTAPELLKIWLGFIPEDSVLFLRVIIATSLFQVFDSCLYTSIDVVGKIKSYCTIVSTLNILCLPATYGLFKLGFPAITACFVLLVLLMVISLLILPVLAVKIADYSFSKIYGVYNKCLIVTIISCIIPFVAYYLIEQNDDFFRLITISIISIISVSISVLWLGMDGDMRMKLYSWIKNKIKNESHK